MISTTILLKQRQNCKETPRSYFSVNHFQIAIVKSSLHPTMKSPTVLTFNSAKAYINMGKPSEPAGSTHKQA